MSADDNDHGSTPAAWTAVSIILLGMTISGFALWHASATAFWAGLGVCLAGSIVGKVMQSLGYGKTPRAGARGSHA